MDIELGDVRGLVTRFAYDARYIMALQVVALVVAAIFYFVMSLSAGVVAATVGLLLIQTYFHTKWLRDDLRDTESYSYSPLLGAVIGVLGIYALGVTASIVILVLIGVLSSVMGISLYGPAMVLMVIGFFIYTYVKM